MKKQLLYINRLLLFVVVLLFSLTPCKVKASLFEIFGATYEQTLNQSKVTSSCTNSCFVFQKSINSKTVLAVLPTISILENNFQFEKKSVQIKRFGKRILLQFPPKYILFKRLKFDMA